MELFKRRGASNHEDSLFGLPLYPQAPEIKDGINVSAQKISQQVDQAIQKFSPAVARKKLADDSEDVWMKRGEDRALALFHAAAEHVPAYKDFLAKAGIKHEEIKTIEDFKKVPTIDKENYLRAYPLEQLCWYGDISASQMISVSSGSSGKPFFWPRAQTLDAETALQHELFLTTHFELDKKSTLFLVCFAMGMYVAGPITMNSLLRMGEKGYPVTVVTPGYAPDEVLRLIPLLAGKYDQIVLSGYPPYVKELIDLGATRGIDWENMDTKFLLAGEGFNEAWRTHIAEKTKQNPLKDFINLYGTADAAVLGFETQASVQIRRKLASSMESRVKEFNDERLPSLLQYNPEQKFFEVIDRELIFTAPGGIPLIRYNIHDHGGVLLQKDMIERMPELADDFTRLEKENQLANLPFVYVFGKSDQTVIVYGANVYPENIKQALEEEDIKEQLSGKFIMYVGLNSSKDQQFNIDIECASGIQVESMSSNARQIIANRIHETLVTINSEYKTSYNGTGSKMIPQVNLFSNGDGPFANRKNKQSWAKKND